MVRDLALNILSRVLAVGLFSLPAAYAGYLSDQETKRNVVNYSPQELSVFVTGNLVNSVFEAYLIVFVIILIIVAFTEAVAYSFRWIFEKFISMKGDLNVQ